tara:strand:- start:3 stop:644 length:642 start_codon:yes stop_codon:yes gene_type:complete
MNITKKEYNKEYRLKNKEQIKKNKKEWDFKNKKHVQEYQKEYDLKNREHLNKLRRERRSIPQNKEHVNKQNKKWRSENPEWVKNYGKNYNSIPQNKERRNKWSKHRRETDPNFKLTNNMMKSMGHALHGRGKSASTMKIIGCTAEGLWKHLESCSSWEPWMTRKNYGKGGWDVDHKIAIKKWDYDCPLQFALCWEKSNLQPMEHIANCRKGAK